MGPLQHRPDRRVRGLTPAIDITTDLPRPADEVWAAVITPAGVNAELAPWVRMTFPAHALGDLMTAPRGQTLFVSWLLAFGVLPFDRHVFAIADAGQGYFIETSHSLLQKTWRHERTVTAVPGGCRVRDVVTVEARIGLAGPMVRAIAAAIFRHRHGRLARLYG